MRLITAIVFAVMMSVSTGFAQTAKPTASDCMILSERAGLDAAETGAVAAKIELLKAIGGKLKALCANERDVSVPMFKRLLREWEALRGNTCFKPTGEEMIAEYTAKLAKSESDIARHCQ